MRYFTSDLHLGHANIIEYCSRPFLDVDMMNDELLARWRDTVAPSNDVWVLGDVALGGNWRELLASVAVLPGRKVLIPGNHDRCWPRTKKRAIESESVYRDVFAEILPDTVATTIGELDLLVSHFPYTGPAVDAKDRYAKTRPVDEGLPLLCGHVHEKWRKRGRQVNVGVDVWDFRPVSESALLALLSGGVRPRGRHAPEGSGGAVRELFDPTPIPRPR